MKKIVMLLLFPLFTIAQNDLLLSRVGYFKSDGSFCFAEYDGEETAIKGDTCRIYQIIDQKEAGCASLSGIEMYAEIHRYLKERWMFFNSTISR